MVSYRARDCRIFQRCENIDGCLSLPSLTLFFFWQSIGMELNPNQGIHIDYDKTGRVSGEAFVHFQTNEDCEKALALNMQKLGHR